MVDLGRLEHRRKEPYKKEGFLRATCPAPAADSEAATSPLQSARREDVAAFAQGEHGNHGIARLSILLTWVLGDQRQCEVITFITGYLQNLISFFSSFFFVLIFPSRRTSRESGT